MTSLLINPGLLMDAKAQADLEGLSLSEVVRQLLRGWLRGDIAFREDGTVKKAPETWKPKKKGGKKGKKDASAASMTLA